ncbi:helix-turn-helix transcriptional regulator [Mesorhizobium sp. BAC0120]|uniref:helix-turn-helix transcriptional regulator n=1 Tax=Mesorhizobium sp. BAC0120 TaxID=3090670 RepID=UPI00298C6828|nr:helix-turn-helix transcriptional regulator [Mesorhizobium sp. BAC0120]MDW6025248.1 helix-turn-helix transcriptional regulator [Mesorhizobium sp. BAC0120]
MIATQSRQQQRELGDFVRAQRERLKPADVGLPAGPRRRTSGLRREEVAQLCGLSVTWYTWLEQGRDMMLSVAALARLARALRLGRAERAYLFELAGKRDPSQGEGEISLVPAATLASVDLIAAPAYILDRSWTARSWNRQAERLFVGWLDTPADRNLLRFIFLEPAARSLISDYETRARRVVAEFRADVSAHLDDPAVRLLITELRSQSQNFERFWDEHGVLGREGGERTFNHPQDGLVRYQQVTFMLAGHADYKLTILTPS